MIKVYLVLQQMDDDSIKMYDVCYSEEDANAIAIAYTDLQLFVVPSHMGPG